MRWTRSSLLHAGGADLANNGKIIGDFPAAAKGTFGSGRNAFTGPRFFNSDISLFKNFAITERVGAQFRFEAFNVFNHVNLGHPNNCIDCTGRPDHQHPANAWRWRPVHAAVELRNQVRVLSLVRSPPREPTRLPLFVSRQTSGDLPACPRPNARAAFAVVFSSPAMNATFPLTLLLLALMLGVPPSSTGQSAASRLPRPAAKDRADDAALVQARSLIQQGRFDEGISQLRQLQARTPALKVLDRELGLAYYQHGNFVEATASLKKALAEDPGDREAVQLLGLSYYFTDKPADAIPLLEKVNSWFPSANVDASYVLGICHIRQRQYDDARKSFALMYGVKPDSAPAYLFAARMLLRQDVELIAEQFAQKAAALDPKLPLVHYLLGEIYLYKSRIPEATAKFEKELAINPAHAATYYKLADAYSRSLKFDDAERLLQRSIWLDATSSGPYILMGKVLLKKNEAELAVRSLQHALDMDPNNYITHHLLGEAFRAQGKSEDATRELKLAEQLQGAQREQP